MNAPPATNTAKVRAGATSRRLQPKIRWAVGAIAVAAIVFLAGMAIGYRQVSPFPEMRTAYHQLRGRVAGRPTPTAELTSTLFRAQLVPDPLYPPIKTLAEIRKHNEAILIPVALFSDAYESLRVTRAQAIRHGRWRLLRVEFELGNRRYDAFAYIGSENWRPEGRKSRATLTIGGSETNASARVMMGGKSHADGGALEAFKLPDNDVFLFAKPNEGVLAFHNGREKLAEDAIVHYHLNRGGSYSASYIVQSLAITKFLQSLYSEVIVAGVSQGGAAALLNALQSKPDIAIVASGYSGIFNIVEHAGHRQIAIPGYDFRSHYDPRHLVGKLEALPTNFLFTYGRRETGLFRFEADHGLSCRYLAAAANVRCAVHDGGHHYPTAEIRSFLEARNAPSRSNSTAN